MASHAPLVRTTHYLRCHVAPSGHLLADWHPRYALASPAPRPNRFHALLPPQICRPSTSACEFSTGRTRRTSCTSTANSARTTTSACCPRSSTRCSRTPLYVWFFSRSGCPLRRCLLRVCVQAQYNATQLLTQREQVSYTIRQSLEQRARDFNILLDDVSIVIVTSEAYCRPT